MTLASGRGGDADGDALPIRADARVLGATLKAGESVTFATQARRHAYLVPSTGRLAINGEVVNARDGAAITGLESVTIEALEDSELVLVDTL